MLKIVNANVDQEIVKPWTADCIILDPPDNLGLKYDGYKDKMDPRDYYQWVGRLIDLSMQKAPVVWVSYFHRHDIEIKKRLSIPQGWTARTFIWAFTFGQDRDDDSGSGYRPILRINKTGWKPSAQDIRVPSWRQENGDKRARPGGKVPLDVWEFPRVTGNSSEKRAWHETQHPEALYIRMMKMSGALGGAWSCVDLFGGTGTALRAGIALGWKNPKIDVTVIEQSGNYCDRMQDENFRLAWPGCECKRV